MTVKTIIRGLIILTLIANTGPLLAQQSPDLTFDQFSMAMSMDASSRDIMNFDYPMGKTKYKNTRRNANTSAKPASLSYTPSASLREATVAAYAARLKRRNPAMAQMVNKMFGGQGKYDYSELYSSTVNNFGLRTNDVADALTANLVLSYLIANNIQGDAPVTASQVAAARSQFAPSLAKNAKLGTPGVPAKLGEEMKLQFVIQRLGWLSAIKNGTAATYGQQVNADVKSHYGMDMTKLQLTDQGFITK